MTALKFMNGSLLVGQGPCLKVYEYKTGKLLCDVRIFQREKIHGICVGKCVFIFS